MSTGADHQVTCIIPDGGDPDRRIDSIGGATGGEGTDGPWKLKLDDVIAGIERGKWRFWTMDTKGNSVWVIIAKRPNGRKYLKTTADDVEPNNLLALPHCP
jgi:Protein of unknown function (DUF3892)